MKTKLFATVAALAAVFVLHAEELQTIPSDELAKAVPLLVDANTRLGELPVKLELDTARAMGVKSDDVGAIFIPDKRLKADKSDKASKKKGKGAAIPVGQLWTSKLSPKVNDAVLPNDRLRLVKIVAKEKERELAMYTLAMEKAGKKAYQLAIYGKDSSPVLRVPLTAAKSKGAASATLAARKTGPEGGVLELSLLGRFKAEIPMGKQAL